MGRDLLAGPPPPPPAMPEESVDKKWHGWIIWLIIGVVAAALTALFHWVDSRSSDGDEDGEEGGLSRWPDARTAFRWSKERLSSGNLDADEGARTPLLYQGSGARSE